MPKEEGNRVLSFAPTSQGSASVKGAGGGQQEWGDRDKDWALHPSRGSRKGSASAERQHLLKQQKTVTGLKVQCRAQINFN